MRVQSKQTPAADSNLCPLCLLVQWLTTTMWWRPPQTLMTMTSCTSWRRKAAWRTEPTATAPCLTTSTPGSTAGTEVRPEARVQVKWFYLCHFSYAVYSINKNLKSNQINRINLVQLNVNITVTYLHWMWKHHERNNRMKLNIPVNSTWFTTYCGKCLVSQGSQTSCTRHSTDIRSSYIKSPANASWVVFICFVTTSAVWLLPSHFDLSWCDVGSVQKCPFDMWYTVKYQPLSHCAAQTARKQVLHMVDF